MKKLQETMNSLSLIKKKQQLLNNNSEMSTIAKPFQIFRSRSKSEKMPSRKTFSTQMRCFKIKSSISLNRAAQHRKYIQQLVSQRRIMPILVICRLKAAAMEA
jgi:hypothetical protein